MNPSQQFVLTPKLMVSIAAGFIGVIVLVAALSFYLTNGRLVLDIQSQSDSEITVDVVGLKNTKVKTIKLNGSGKHSLWLPTDSYNISLGQDHRHTLALGKVGLFRATTLNLSTKDEAASSKLAGQSLGCGLLSKAVYYSYSCFKDSRIYRHTGTTLQSISADEYRTISPLGSGAIASATSATPVFTYIELSTGQKTPIALPAALRTIDPYDISAVPNQTGGNTYQFALVSRTTNTWYLYQSLTDQKPFEIMTAKANDKLKPYTFQLNGDQATTFFGPKPSGTHGEIERASDTQAVAKDETNYAPSQFAVYSLTAKQLRHNVTLPEPVVAADSSAPDQGEVLNMYLASTNTAVAEVVNGGVAIYHLDANAIKYVGSMPDATTLTIGDNRVVFSRGSSVYELNTDNTTANRLFEASGFKVSSLGISGNTVLMQAFTGQEGQTVTGLPSAFGLDITKSASYPRAEWDLPRKIEPTPTPAAASAPTPTPASGSTSTKPATYSKLESLLDSGISSFQLDALKYALGQFSKAKGKTLTTAVLEPSSIKVKPRDRNSTAREEVTFTLRLNNQDTYNARMEYFDITTIRLFLTDPTTSKVVYDSKDLNITN